MRFIWMYPKLGCLKLNLYLKVEILIESIVKSNIDGK